jgi:uncharacterized protein
VKLHVSSAAGLNVLTSYGEGFVAVNGVRHESNLIVLPERVQPWPAASFEALEESHFAELASAGLEVVLLGTGAKLRFPHPRITRALTDARIGIDVMDLGAACRTFNVLVAEGRKVAAALLLR